MLSWSEKELEDWLMDDGHLWDFLEELYSLHREELGVANRQVKTPVGVIDIMGHCGGMVFVIELKCGMADGNALAQVLDYRNYVKNLTFEASRGQYRPHVEAIIVARDFDRRVISASEEACVRMVRACASFSFADNEDTGIPDCSESGTNSIAADFVEKAYEFIESAISHESGTDILTETNSEGGPKDGSGEPST